MLHTSSCSSCSRLFVADNILRKRRVRHPYNTGNLLGERTIRHLHRKNTQSSDRDGEMIWRAMRPMRRQWSTIPQASGRHQLKLSDEDPWANRMHVPNYADWWTTQSDVRWHIHEHVVTKNLICYWKKCLLRHKSFYIWFTDTLKWC